MSEEAVLEANQAFYSAFNQKDLAAMDAIWARTTEVGCIHPGWNVLSGRELVMESWEAILENPNQPKVMTGGASVSLLGSTQDVAVVSCRELVAGSALAATNIFIHEQGTWKLVHHQSGPVSLG
jgi:hypothetical protein